MMLAILFALKTMELLENGLQPKSGEMPLFLMRAVSLVSCRDVAALTLMLGVNGP